MTLSRRKQTYNSRCRFGRSGATGAALKSFTQQVDSRPPSRVKVTPGNLESMTQPTVVRSRLAGTTISTTDGGASPKGNFPETIRTQAWGWCTFISSAGKYIETRDVLPKRRSRPTSLFLWWRLRQWILRKQSGRRERLTVERPKLTVRRHLRCRLASTARCRRRLGPASRLLCKLRRGLWNLTLLLPLHLRASDNKIIQVLVILACHPDNSISIRYTTGTTTLLPLCEYSLVTVLDHEYSNVVDYEGFRPCHISTEGLVSLSQRCWVNAVAYLLSVSSLRSIIFLVSSVRTKAAGGKGGMKA
jgi:hypothetical protein